MNYRSMTSRTMLAVLTMGSLVTASCHERYSRGPTAPFDFIAGSGNVVQQNRPASAIRELSLVGIGTVEITVGTTESLVVEAEDNLLQYLRTEMVGGTLVISKDPTVSLRPTRPIVFHLGVQRLERAELTGAGNIRCSGLTADRLSLSASGVGDVDFSGLNLRELDVNMTGVGSVQTSGTTEQQVVRLTGVGSYKGRNLQSADATVTLHSVGSATVRVSDHLDVTVNGSGCVYYIGNPQVNSVVTGVGCLSRID